MGLMMFTAILTVGQLVFAWGVHEVSFLIMIAGSVIFGLGGECMTVS